MNKPTIIKHFPGEEVDKYLKKCGHLPGEKIKAWFYKNHIYYRRPSSKFEDMFKNAVEINIEFI